MQSRQEMPPMQKTVPIGRGAFTLLAALTVALGALVTPLAGTANAGGLNGGVVGSRGSIAVVDTAGSKLGSGTDGALVAFDQGEDTIDTTGSKPGLGAGSGGGAAAPALTDPVLSGGRGGISGDCES